MAEGFAPVVGGVSGVVVDGGKVLLVRRAKDPYRGRWSLPGGGVEPGETLREAVRREVGEETGLEVEVGTVAGYREERVGSSDHCIVVAFHVRVTGGRLRAGDDAAEVEFVDPARIGDRPTTPGLSDVLRDAGPIDR